MAGKVDSTASKLVQTLVGLLNGSIPRSNFTPEQWDGLMQAIGNPRQGDTYAKQPLEAIADWFHAHNLGDVFKQNLAEGEKNGTWVQDPSTDSGWVYNPQAPQPGESPTGNGNGNGSGQYQPPPPPPPGGKHQAANTQASFENMVMGLGLSLDANLQTLIAHATQGGWNAAFFQQQLYQTPEFHQQYPGIFNADGSLKMSPTQYNANVQQFQTYANKYGINYNDKLQTWLFNNNVSASEFADRAAADASLRTNKQYFDAFNQQLKQMGEAPLTKSDMLKFILGEGNQKWYDLWNQATARYSGEQAGIHFGNTGNGYTNLSQHVIKRVGGLGLTQAQEQSGFADLAKTLNTVMPLSQIQKFGISKKDLVTLEFGGANQAAIAQKVSQVMANFKALKENQTTMSRTAPTEGPGSRLSNNPNQYTQGA